MSSMQGSIQYLIKVSGLQVVGISTGGVVLVKICVPPVGLCYSSQPANEICSAYNCRLKACRGL